MNQRGFATLEVILMVMVIGILASIAIPRFGDITTRANTARIQADLSTIDTAIALYYMEKGNYPDKNDSLNVLIDYLQNTSLKPPSGKAYIKGENGEPTPTDISGNYGFTEVTLSNGNKVIQAALGNKTADNFYVP